MQGDFMSMPTDNGKDYFVKDFYQRTLQIVNSYNGEYDVALLINAMVGLLIVPREAYFKKNNIPDCFTSPDLLEKIRNCVKANRLDGKEQEKTLKEIVRHLRNAVAHGHLTIKGEKPVIENDHVEIYSVKFVDKYKFYDEKSKKYHRTNFKAEIPVDLLKEFLINFATNVCNESNAKKVNKKRAYKNTKHL